MVIGRVGYGTWAKAGETAHSNAANEIAKFRRVIMGRSL
jgi:hypothetical protein